MIQIIHQCQPFQSSHETLFDRPCLMRLRCFFSSSRRCMAALGTVDFFRGMTSFRDSRNNDAKRSIASSRLEAWVRCFWETTLRIPSLFIRVGRWFRINCFCLSERHGELTTSNQRVTRVLTLFTFWPPGPLLRLAVNLSWHKGMESVSVISIDGRISPFFLIKKSIKVTLAILTLCYMRLT